MESKFQLNIVFTVKKRLTKKWSKWLTKKLETVKKKLHNVKLRNV